MKSDSVPQGDNKTLLRVVWHNKHCTQALIRTNVSSFAMTLKFAAQQIWLTARIIFMISCFQEIKEKMRNAQYLAVSNIQHKRPLFNQTTCFTLFIEIALRCSE